MNYLDTLCLVIDVFEPEFPLVLTRTRKNSCRSHSITQYTVEELRLYLFFWHRFGDSEGESLAITPQQGSGGTSWPPDHIEDSDNQRNVRRTGQTSIQIPPVTITSPPGETTLIQSQYLLAYIWLSLVQLLPILIFVWFFFWFLNLILKMPQNPQETKQKSLSDVALPGVGSLKLILALALYGLKLSWK